MKAFLVHCNPPHRSGWVFTLIEFGFQIRWKNSSSNFIFTFAKHGGFAAFGYTKIRVENYVRTHGTNALSPFEPFCTMFLILGPIGRAITVARYGNFAQAG
jgi:hypothetical protein